MSQKSSRATPGSDANPYQGIDRGKAITDAPTSRPPSMRFRRIDTVRFPRFGYHKSIDSLLRSPLMATSSPPSADVDPSNDTQEPAGAHAGELEPGVRYKGARRDEIVIRAVLDSVRTGVRAPEDQVRIAADAMPRWMRYRGITLTALRYSGIPDDLLMRLRLIPGEPVEVVPMNPESARTESGNAPGGGSDEQAPVADERVILTGESVIESPGGRTSDQPVEYLPQVRGPGSTLREDILVTLAALPGGRLAEPSGLTNGVLRTKMGYQGSPMNVSRMLGVLDDEGLIERVIFGKRCPVIELTEQGKAVAAPMLAKALAVQPTSDLTAPDDESTTEKRAQGSSLDRQAANGQVVNGRAVNGSTVRRSDSPIAGGWGRHPGQGAPSTTDERSLSDEDVVWQMEGESAPVSPLEARLRKVQVALDEERRLTDDLRQRLVVSNEDRTDLRLRVKALEDEVLMYKARSEQLEKNLDAVMRGPDRSLSRQIEEKRMSAMISSRPG